MAGTSRTAGQLLGVLNALSAGEIPAPATGINAADLAGRSAREVSDAIANAIRPSDGTLDAEASRNAIANAFSDLLEQDVNVDLISLTPEQIEFILERFVAYDLSLRIELDVGSHIQDKAPSAAVAVTRIEDLKAYVRECVAAQFRAFRESGKTLTRSAASAIASAVIHETFQVFAAFVP